MPTIQESQAKVTAARAEYEAAEERMRQAKQDMQAALSAIEEAQAEQGLSRRERAAEQGRVLRP